MKTPDLVYPRRSAHASIRGYLYQATLGVRRWLELEAGEVLVCEGDEDLDRLFLTERHGLSEQVKVLSGGVEPRTIREVLRRFLLTYAALAQTHQDRRFRFTAFGGLRRSSSRDSPAKVLDRWNDPEARPKVLSAVRDWLVPRSEDGDREPPNDEEERALQRAIAWLDEDPERWNHFLGNVEWCFEDADLDALRGEVMGLLAGSPQTAFLPAAELLDRLLAEIFASSSQPLPGQRVKTREDLLHLLSEVEAGLARWATLPVAARLRALHSEQKDLHDLLDPGDRELPTPREGAELPPSKLLVAAYEVIPFQEAGRGSVLAALADWCAKDARASVWLIAGEGGLGKTRLSIEWCRRLRHQGWHAGLLPETATEGDLPRLLEGTVSRFVVVDYAEGRTSMVRSLLRRAARPKSGPKIRILLLARHVADWWGELAREGNDLDDLLLASPEPLRLAAVEVEGPLRHEIYEHALAYFSPLLRVTTGGPRPHRVDLSEELFRRPLYIHMASLAVLSGVPVIHAGELLARTLEHERLFWHHEVHDLEGLPGYLREKLEAAFGRTMAVVTLAGGIRGAADLERLIDGVARPSLPEDLVPVLGNLIARLYGGSAGKEDPAVAALEPDLLGEQLVLEALRQDSMLVDVALEHGSGGSVLRVLNRLAQREADAREWLDGVLRRHTAALARLALDVAVATGDPIGGLLAQVLSETSADPGLIADLQHRCEEPALWPSVPLREVALVTTAIQIDSLRREARDRFEARSELARLLCNLSLRLRDLGRHEEALSATEESVDLYRGLATEQPSFLLDLARSLNNQGLCLSELGRHEEALAAVHGVVELRRRMAAHQPNVFQPDLALSLINVGGWAYALGRYEAALGATQEAVNLYRELATNQPDRFRVDLAMSLSNLGALLAALSRFEEALAANQEAVDTCRGLAAERPDAFRPDLATSLNNLGVRLSEMDRREEALAVTQEAVDLCRDFATERPGAFLGDLAMSLNNLGIRLRELERHEEALAAAQESVDLCRSLAAERPAAVRPNLAATLHNLGNCLGVLGRLQEAEAATQEAIELRRRLVAKRPDAFRPDLAMSLENLGRWLADLNRRKEALAATQEAVDLYQGLAVQRPGAFRPELAKSLTSLGSRFSDLGRHEEALAASRRGLGLRRHLAAERPSTFRPDLAMSLYHLSIPLGDLGRHEEALSVTQEAVDLWRGLSAERPTTFRADLARSLNNLGGRFADLDRLEEALAATREAVDLFRDVAAEQPEAFRPDLALALDNLGMRLSKLRRHDDALMPTQQAVELYRGLATARPDTFRPDLARSLNNLGTRFANLDRLEEALPVFEEAVRELAPQFLAVPKVLALWMKTMLGNYLKAAETLEQEPDDEFLLSLAHGFASIEATSPEEEPEVPPAAAGRL